MAKSKEYMDEIYEIIHDMAETDYSCIHQCHNESDFMNQLKERTKVTKLLFNCYESCCDEIRSKY